MEVRTVLPSTVDEVTVEWLTAALQVGQEPGVGSDPARHGASFRVQVNRPTL